MNPKRFSLLLLALLAVAVQGCLLLDIRPVGRPGQVKKDDLPKVQRYQGDRVYSFLGPDSIPALDEPQMVMASEASFMDDDEQVIGVVHDGVAKAYSAWHLDRHEVVNDWLGRKPVAVTW